MDILTLMAAALVLLGGLAALISRSAFNKLILLGVLTAGAVMFFVKGGYLDAAIAVSLLMPVGTLFILFLMGKKKEVRND